MIKVVEVEGIPYVYNTFDLYERNPSDKLKNELMIKQEKILECYRFYSCNIGTDKYS